MGMDRARVARLQPSRDARIYEVTQPSDFVDLVARYPLPLDRARRHEWFQATGSRGPWLIPDWAAVGEDYDAVHLTVLGYLATAGRALPVLDQFTVLAGWEPSETWWLNDVLQEATEPTTWKESKSGRWRPIPYIRVDPRQPLLAAAVAAAMSWLIFSAIGRSARSSGARRPEA